VTLAAAATEWEKLFVHGNLGDAWPRRKEIAKEKKLQKVGVLVEVCFNSQMRFLWIEHSASR